MQIIMGSRGNGKTYRLVMQALMNNGIFITKTPKQAKNINENILPEVIKDFKEKMNLEYDCKEIAFCIDNYTYETKCLVDKNDNKEYAAVFECIWEKTDIGKGD